MRSNDRHNFNILDKDITITDLDKQFRRITLNLIYQCEIGKINSNILADDLKALSYQYRKNRARISGAVFDDAR